MMSRSRPKLVAAQVMSQTAAKINAGHKRLAEGRGALEGEPGPSGWTSSSGDLGSDAALHAEQSFTKRWRISLTGGEGD